MITNTMLVVPHYNYVIMGPKNPILITKAPTVIKTRVWVRAVRVYGLGSLQAFPAFTCIIRLAEGSRVSSCPSLNHQTLLKRVNAATLSPFTPHAFQGPEPVDKSGSGPGFFYLGLHARPRAGQCHAHDHPCRHHHHQHQHHLHRIRTTSSPT